ncbi:MAG: hypothetical protein AUJ48_03455 [Deltaproteobacteria bacterium CG1_02_45_11]|nr:MAG: hypothetical protein AUJ48_03455 [Deltaproteobacteria bacterium CG1_02_45_11]
METDIILEKLAKASGVLAACALILSVIHDWGFFFALDIGFIDIPTSIGDHIRSALIWLPNILFCFFIVIAIEFVNQRIERGLTEEEIIQSSKKPERLRKFRQGPAVLFRILAPVLVAGFLLIGNFYRGILPIALVVCWAMFSEWANNAPLIKIRRSETTQKIFHWLPIIFFFVFFWGYNNASDLASDDVPRFKLTLSNADRALEVNILRHVEKGTLVIEPKTKKITLISWPEVLNLEPIEPYKPYFGIFGRFFDEKVNPAANKANSADAKNRAAD